MAKKHWIYIKRGLSEDPKHRAQMGECIWLYMHIIDRADWETGIAYDWKDNEEAADMAMEPRTLRYQRQKLEKLDYIRCKQKQHSQDIKIMNWVNPRDYSAGVLNKREDDFQGDNKTAPSNFQDDSQGDNQDDSQGRRQIVTPTSSSKSYIRDHTKSPDFSNMTLAQALKVPTLKLFRDAAGWFPADVLWEQVHTFILENSLTHEQIKTATVAWVGRGYNRRNVMGILEWAKNGIPSNGHKPETATPAINEASVQKTMKEIEEKWNFKPALPPAERPRIGKPNA